MKRAPDPRLALLLVLALLAGCITLPFPSRKSPPVPLPDYLARNYDYTPVSLESQLQSQKSFDGFTRTRMVLTAPQDPSISSTTIDWYKPESDGEASSSRRPLILISPILAGNDLYIKDFARHFAVRGLHAVIVYRKKETFSEDRGLADIETHLRETVIRLRQVLDWLQAQPGVDSKRIGTFAISLGAMVTVVLAAVDDRIQASVFGLPAGHIPEILMTSKDKTIRKRRRNYMKENHLTEEQLLLQLKEVIVSDPVDFVSSVDPDRTLMIAGVFDRVIGFGRSMELWRKMGRPRLILLPTGHYTAALATPWLKIITYSFLKRRLLPSK